MLLIIKHETITQKNIDISFFSVLNYTKTSKHIFDFLLCCKVHSKGHKICEF